MRLLAGRPHVGPPLAYQPSRSARGREAHTRKDSCTRMAAWVASWAGQWREICHAPRDWPLSPTASGFARLS